MSAKKSTGKGNRRGSSRPARGKLRRFHDIENVIVEEPFSLFKPAGATGGGEEDRKAGDGCYVTATVHNRRYYGVLVDQETLKNASLLWFQEEAGSLDLNRRMKHLQGQVSTTAATTNGTTSNPDTGEDVLQDLKPEADSQKTNGDITNTADESNADKKRPAAPQDMDSDTKRIKLDVSDVVPDAVASGSSGDLAGISVDPAAAGLATSSVAGPLGHQRQVQKFSYVEPADMKNKKDVGYRNLLATYADISAASEDDPTKSKQIEDACQAGGGFVGKYYSHPEVMRNALQTAISIPDQDDGMRTSMGFDSFLLNTHLPRWFPLSNLHIGQHKVLSLLNMKKDNNGNVIWDAEAESTATSSSLKGTHVPMEPRNRYRIGIMGGGISGLACSLELLRLCDSQNIDVEIVLIEGRDRLGGRLLTDKETFSHEHGKPFPVDLGAGWIHGIDHNPLASLAREAGVSFVTASEEVKMMHAGLREVDKVVDDNMGKLFDDLLDLGADDCWGANDTAENGARKQMAVRWYSANLKSESETQVDVPQSSGPPRQKGGETKKDLGLKKTDAPVHRHSSDMSIDYAIGKAISKHRFREFSKLTKNEYMMLEWHRKNVEYALGANVSDLSMKFWDSDERHAFEGDHVLLREGYSNVVEHMVRQLKQYGDHKFKAILNFPIGKVEYARRSTTQKYPDRMQRKLVELSDTCCVTKEDGSMSVKCDFLLCTLPLGVLKHSLAYSHMPSESSENDSESVNEKVVFEPPLPFSKCDSINTVGFGLLDKLYLQFETPFWRKPLGLEGDKYLFGNSTGIHSHYYMFTDLGMTLGSEEGSPPILMTLVSGKEAVHCETLTEEAMVGEALDTLREILAPIEVPSPIAVKRTQWGLDKFSRGCYTFLPPGATDQDFNMLQSPVNGNGDSLLLEGSETMRMFFAGEHTTALHPSMAHGAMLSGIRAAKEIVSTLSFSFHNDKASDRLIPVALFRRDNPDTPLQCSLCHEMGSRVREGSLLALKRGARQVFVHNNCAEYSPEVEVYEGQWRNVIKAVNRGKALTCALCNRSGATIGCTHPQCFRVYHFSCSEDTGWRFDREGKVYYCDLHRKHPPGDHADRISLKFYKSKTAYAVVRCFLCGGADEDEKAGKLFAFQRLNRRVLVHEKCARFTNVVDTKEDSESRMGVEFGNVFEAIEKAGTCAKCGRHGATIGCSSCDLCYHYPCALETGWKSNKRGSKFACEYHQKNHSKVTNEDAAESSGGIFQHALFSSASTGGSTTKVSMPSNSNMGGTALKAGSHEEIYISSDSSDSEESVQSNGGVFKRSNKDLLVTSKPALSGGVGEPQQVRLTRATLKSSWGFSFVAKRDSGSDKYCLLVDKRQKGEVKNDLEDGQIIRSLNGVELGSAFLVTFKDVLSYLERQIDIMIGVTPGMPLPVPVKVESKPPST